jgi:hypothetical protein
MEAPFAAEGRDVGVADAASEGEAVGDAVGDVEPWSV